MILNAGAQYGSRNVLADPDIREGIKEFTKWPTIPQVRSWLAALLALLRCIVLLGSFSCWPAPLCMPFCQGQEPATPVLHDFMLSTPSTAEQRNPDHAGLRFCACTPVKDRVPDVLYHHCMLSCQVHLCADLHQWRVCRRQRHFDGHAPERRAAASAG